LVEARWHGGSEFAPMGRVSQIKGWTLKAEGGMRKQRHLPPAENKINLCVREPAAHH
jgi:hypothetical protein